MVILLLLAGFGNVCSQEASGDRETLVSPTAEGQRRLMLAESNPEYPITPGDVFRLSYVSSLGTESVTVTVDGDYTLNMGILGNIDTENLVLSELRERMAAAVRRAYPGSYPNVLLVRTGTFSVFVDGEVNASYYAVAWGLTRLSEILKNHLTAYSSTRNVRITSTNGSSRSYDLFRASRYGDTSEDPHLKPGDTVLLSKAERTVDARGKVRRAGTYQLLAGDTLHELLELYADGFPPGADTERITIQRRSDDEAIYKVFEIDSSVTNLSAVDLKDADTISVPDRSKRLPVVYFEGAVTPNGKLRYTLKQGDTMYRALTAIQDQIAPVADLSAAVMIKPGMSEQVPINLEKLLHTSPGVGDFALVPGDRIVIPYGTHEVFLSGEVKTSGWFTVEPLTRLSAIIREKLTPYSSDRDIRITSEDGQEEYYDLFRTRRFGEEEEDPYLKPGDTVFISKAERTVDVWGKVRRPGTYQLLAGDTLHELLEVYADGFPPGADTERITIERRSADEAIYKVFEIDSSVTNLSTVQLEDADTISVPDRSKRLPVVYFEGAVTPNGKLRYTLKEGDTMYRALTSIEDRIAPGADLSAAVMIKPRMSEQVPVNLEKLLHTSPGSNDFQLVAGDRIIIPHGIHEVFISGEVRRAGRFKAEPLTRLSEIVTDKFTPYSSDRDIKITSAEGQADYYDLFRARRYGEEEEDPYLSPGDIITIGRLERRAKLEGEVERPGEYQLVTGESLANLVDFYGSGFTKMADLEEVELIRYDTQTGNIAETIYIDCTDPAWREFQLRDLDRIIVPPKTRKLPFVLFEGAVYRERSIEDGTTLETSNRIQYVFEEGELLSTAVQNLKQYFTEVSDLKNAYITHADGQTTPIDLELLLFRQPNAKDIELKAFDRIMVPFRQFFVIVSGAVLTPGRYPYIPDRTYQYYIDLAGGFDPQRHSGSAVSITDIDNNVLNKDDPIGPETKIVAPNNNPLYVFGQISGILGTIISVTTLVITLLR